MRQTRPDPVDYARIIVYGCLARDACKKSSAVPQRAVKATSRGVEPDSRPHETSIASAVWLPRYIALLMIPILAAVAWLVSGSVFQ